jgi:hypothetical protein
MKGFFNILDLFSGARITSATVQQVFHMTVSVTSLTFSRVTENVSDFLSTSDVSHICEIQVTTVGHRLTSESLF